MKMKRRSEFIPFARPSFTEEEEQAVVAVLRSGWVSSAKAARELELAFQRTLRCAYASAVNSATAGLHLAVKAVGIGEGNEVITTPFTFTSTAEVCRYENAHPLFADIDASTFNIDVKEVEKLLESRNDVKACIPVHIAGRLCDMKSLLELGAHYNVPLIEDASHAFPVQSSLGYAGTIGDVGVFSFYATKPITTGEGGMVVTGSEKLAQTIRNLRLHGIDRIVWDRYHEKKFSWEYDIIAPGYKYNLSDILAAIGVVQLKKADLFLQRRREIAEQYTKAFGDEDYLILPETDENHCFHLYILRLRTDMMTVTRDEFLQRLSEANIGVSVHYRPLHLMTYYRKTYDLKPEDFPNALAVYQSCFSIPIFDGLTDEEVGYIIKTIREVGRKFRK